MDALSISTNSSDKYIDVVGSPLSASGTILFHAKPDFQSRCDKKGLKFEGHRGAGLLEPENSIRSFERCLDLGLDAIELDVWISIDNIPIVIHGTDDGIAKYKDPSLDKHVTQIDSKLLKEHILPNGEIIPTLEEVLLICKSKIRVNIELKEETKRVVKPTIELIVKLGMLDQVCFSSFIHQHKIWLEEVRVELGIEQTLEFGFLVWTLPDFGELLERASAPDVITIDTDLLEKHEEFILKEIAKAKSKGMKVKFYFCFEKEENEEIYKKLEDLGVDSLIINHPLKCQEFRSNQRTLV